MTPPSLTSSGAGRSRSPRASKSTTPPTSPPAADAISRGDLALRPEGHAPDIALLDLQRRGSEPLAPGVEEHHAADAARRTATYPAAILPSGPKATLLTSPSLTSSGAGRSRSPRASKSTTPPPRAEPPYPAAILPSGPKATLLTSPSLTSSGAVGAARPGRRRAPRRRRRRDAISRGDLALRPEGHARDIALLDLQRRGSEPLAPGVEEHHAAASRHIPRRSCPPARRPRS